MTPTWKPASSGKWSTTRRLVVACKHLPRMLSKSPRQTTVTAGGLGEHSYQVFDGLLASSASEIDAPVERGITGDMPNPDA